MWFVFFCVFCLFFLFFFFFFNDTATTEIYTLSLHDALPIPARRSLPARLSRLNWGLCRERGIVRTSASCSTPWASRSSRSSFSDRVQCPIVRTIVGHAATRGLMAGLLDWSVPREVRRSEPTRRAARRADMGHVHCRCRRGYRNRVDPPLSRRREHLGRLLLDYRALEEVWIHLAPKAHGVREGEVSEVAVVEQSVLDQLVRLRHHFGHVGDIEMADVRAEERVQTRAHWVGLAVEGPRVDGVVGLAAEIVGADVQILEVLLAADLAP